MLYYIGTERTDKLIRKRISVMKVIEVARAFFEKRQGRSANISSDGKSLVSYSTTVMRWEGRTLFVSPKSYTRTTSRHTNAVLSLAKEHNKNPDNIRIDIVTKPLF
jgi:hypothetical protein